MSGTMDNPEKRKEQLKHLILQLHKGETPDQVKKQLINLLHTIPYKEVIEAEQELMAEGLSEEEILRFCDIHTAVLDGNIDHTKAKSVPPGHPVDTFLNENQALKNCIKQIKTQLTEIPDKNIELAKWILQLKTLFNNLSDVDKHYKRKEYLLFPFIEKAGITGPPKVMWGKHDEIRTLLRSAHKALSVDRITKKEAEKISELSLRPVIDAIEGMIMKEEEILFPMCLDTLDEAAWYQIYRETPEFGFCLYDPKEEWIPENVQKKEPVYLSGQAVYLSSGSFSMKELETLFTTLPIDITFVDKDDKVKFFSHSPNRIFERNRSIIGRDVRMCHPPGSIHIVEQIINDFKSGKENKAAFWISNFKERFIYIEYTALRSTKGEYLGTIEVTQDITELRKLKGDQRLLSYAVR